jgi:hypothetical protein
MSIKKATPVVKHAALTRRTALTVAIAVGMGLSGQVFAQASTGSIFGSAPVAAGETVVVQNTSIGMTREVPVDSKGRYSLTSLPLGVYNVSLMKGGAVVDTRHNVTLMVGGGTQVSFDEAEPAGTTNLTGVTVVANALPAIDVSQVDSRTVVTAQQLARLPLQRTAEAIATLAPGVNQGSSYFTSPTGQVLNSFGGASIAENAYYINGFNTTDPLHGFGGLTLPYGAIDQEQVLTGGYGAAYGRSDGGVINQVGKRGSNEWHFGAQILWRPEFAESDPNNVYYPSGPIYLPNADGGNQGQPYEFRNDNKSWRVTEDLYAGGPLIKDKLFFFGAVEADRQLDGKNVGTVESGTATNYSYNDPKWYAKLDWNITDDNILELTGASNKTEYSGNVYDFNYDADGRNHGVYGAFKSPATHTKDGADLWVAKYTGYITDNLTIDALYGKMKQTDYSEAAGGPEAYIGNPQFQNPAYGGGAIVGPQTSSQVNNPGAADKTRNLRLDINYKLGDHSITAGIDNLDLQSLDIGTVLSGTGQFQWIYGKSDPNSPISTLPGQEVGAPGGQGYWVDKDIYTTGASSVRVKQRAQFIEDRWQVSDRVLLSLGLRNDQFTNYNPDGKAYIRLTSPQWSPRLGVTWDVFGDSSLKVYANAGRYYLDEPANVAIRGASGSTYTDQYFTYTGIDPATGAPTGLTQIPQGHYPGVSANNEFGVPPDPKQVTSKNVKAEDQDEYIAGVDKSFDMFGTKWTAGAKGTYRVLRNMLDDVCETTVFGSEGVAQGFDEAAAEGAGCYIMNPGRSSSFNVPLASGGYGTMNIPWSAFGEPNLLRKYAALNLYLEHPFDGKWYGRIDYVWSHSFGNSEGSVRSDIGQSDVSQTEDWDNSGVMTYANGDQANDRRHQIKMIGYYQITPEWLVGGNVQILSGTPRTCLGYFPVGDGTQTDPFGYRAGYHFCGPDSKPAPGGATGRTPWQEIVSVNAEYRPAWADHKLAFNVMVYNLFDQQRVTQYYPTSESGPGLLSKDFWVPVSLQQPRYVQLGVTYDF